MTKSVQNWSSILPNSTVENCKGKLLADIFCSPICATLHPLSQIIKKNTNKFGLFNKCVHSMIKSLSKTSHPLHSGIMIDDSDCNKTVLTFIHNLIPDFDYSIIDPLVESPIQKSVSDKLFEDIRSVTIEDDKAKKYIYNWTTHVGNCRVKEEP